MNYNGILLSSSRSEPDRFVRLKRVIDRLPACDQKRLGRLDDNKGLLTAWWLAEQEDRCVACSMPHGDHPIVAGLHLHQFVAPEIDSEACERLTRIWYYFEDEEFVEHRFGRPGQLMLVAEGGMTVEPREASRDRPIGGA